MDKCLIDGSITMGVELHGVSDNISHLVVASVVHSFHGVEDASLYGFESVIEMRNSTLKDDVAGIFEEPRLVHPAEVVGDAILHQCWVVVGVRWHAVSLCR